MKIRKKPIMVDALRWWEPGDPRHDPLLSLRVMTGPPLRVGDIQVGESGGTYFIKTAQDMVRLNRGDWILTDPTDGDSWPVSDALVKEKYEVVELDSLET